MKNSAIEWTTHTFNPWEGCTKVSPGCAHCYAEARNHRFGMDNWGKGKPRRRTSASNWKQPLKWNKMTGDAYCRNCQQLYAPGVVGKVSTQCPECYSKLEIDRPRVFCASLADWLDDEVPIEWLADLLKLIHDTPNLDWLMLTKRPENWRGRIEEALTLWEDAPECVEEMTAFLDSWLDCIDMPERGDLPQNIWIGTTVEDQLRAKERIPKLLEIPAKIRFLSCEPLLEAIDIQDALLPTLEQAQKAYRNEDAGWPHIQWVICGGESGPGSRPFRVDWARSLRDQCKSAGIAFFMKQFGANIVGQEMDKWVTRVRDKKGGNWEEWPQELRIREIPNAKQEALL